MQHTNLSSVFLDSLHQAGLGLREQWELVASETDNKDGEESLQKMSSLNTSIEQTVNLTAQLPALRDSISALRAENALLRAQLSSLHFKQPPPEILRMIFGFATSAPFSDPALSHGPNSLWCQTMRTKKAVMLVCKLWRDVGAEFLYEDVVLRRPAQPALLLRTLETPGIDYGHHISSLLFNCVTEPSDYDDPCRVLGGILSVSPRITSFGLVNPYYVIHPQDAGIFVRKWSKMLNWLAHSPCSVCLSHIKLAVADAHNILGGFDPLFMKNFPKLSSLDLDIDPSHVLVNNEDEELASYSQIDAPELRHIRCTVKGDTSFAHHHILSSIISNPCSLQLNMLTISFSKFLELASPIRELFQICGPQLTYLHLIERQRSLVPFKSHNVQEFMDHFPKLEHLVVPIQLVETHQWSHPTLRWLDVWTFPVGKRLRTRLPRLTLNRERCPNLISIRRLDINLSYRSIDIAIRLPPDTTFPPGVWKRTFGLSNTSYIVQTSHKIVLKEIGYIFDAPHESSSDESTSGDSSPDEREESLLESDDREWLSRPTDSEESSAESDGTDSSSMVSAEG